MSSQSCIKRRSQSAMNGRRARSAPLDVELDIFRLKSQFVIKPNIMTAVPTVQGRRHHLKIYLMSYQHSTQHDKRYISCMLIEFRLCRLPGAPARPTSLDLDGN